MDLLMPSTRNVKCTEGQLQVSTSYKFVKIPRNYYAKKSSFKKPRIQETAGRGNLQKINCPTVNQLTANLALVLPEDTVNEEDEDIVFHYEDYGDTSR